MAPLSNLISWLALFVCLAVSYFISFHEPPVAMAHVQNSFNVTHLRGLYVKDAADVGTKAGGALVKVPATINSFVVRVDFESDNDGHDQNRRVLLYQHSDVNSDCSRKLCWQNPRVLALQGSSTETLQRSDYRTLLVTSWRYNPNAGNEKDGIADDRIQTAQTIENGRAGTTITFTLGQSSGSTRVTILPQ